MTDLSEMLFGAGGRNRTVMELPPEDFESYPNDTGQVSKGSLLLDKLRNYNVFTSNGMLAGNAVRSSIFWCRGHTGGHTIELA